MQREIKFRIWDKQNKRFVSSPHSHFHLLGQEEYVFQQFVGREDSFGSDIYEGDILEAEKSKIRYEIKFDPYFARYAACEKKIYKSYHSIEGIFDEEVIVFKNGLHRYEAAGSNGKIKIIGHIYE